MRLRAIAKETIYGIAFAVGAQRFLRMRHGGDLIVLTYHSVGMLEQHPYLDRMPPERFREQLEYLKASYDVVALDEGLIRLAETNGKTCGGRAMVTITADDGYCDNYEHLHPIARGVGVRPTIFLATHYLDSGRLPWPTHVSALLHFATRDKIDIPRTDGIAQPVPIVTRRQRDRAFRALLQYMSQLDHAAREVLLEQLENALAPRDMVTLAPLSWEQVREMRSSGVVFGAHTQFHGWLDRVSSAELDRELTLSKARIEEETGVPCEMLAYPNGNWNADVAKAARRAGYRYAMTQDTGVNREVEQHQFALRRIQVPFDERLGTFACRVGGVALL
jgi:peptidoglycan/xylan/chitin deacetylase (PgdA/CDA1 family)